MLYNLLSNAVKFTNDDGEVRLVIQPRGAARFAIEVHDTGLGIKREDIPRLFREFEQLDSGAARRYEGTGLGLALTKRLVEFQGGSIGVVSTPGRGSTFTLELPLVTHPVKS